MAGVFANGGKPLGKLRGVFFTTGENRNDYPCKASSAANAESDELAQEKLATGGIIGRLDHTNHNPDTNPNDETLVKEAAVNMRKFPKLNSSGEYIGECLILDTPDGQKIYAYCKSGKKPGVSYRGSIDEDAYFAGDMEKAWEQFTVEGFDIVMVPAYKECYLELAEDYVDADSDVYVEFKEEYLDNDAPISKKASRKRAGIDAEGAARAMIRVAASKKGAKEMAKVMAQDKHFTAEEMVKINKAIDDVKVDGDRRTKEQADELGTPYESTPKHTWSRQEGNGTLDMHHEEAIYGEDDVDPVTGQKIETLNTGNKSEKDRKIVGKQTDKQKAEASINVDKKVQELAEETADELVAEEIEKKKVKSGVEKGTVADKEVDEEEELKGYVDKDGKVIKKAGVLGVKSEDEVDEEDEKKGDLEKGGKVTKASKSTKSAITQVEAGTLGVKADEEESEVEFITEDGIKELNTEIVKDESAEDSETTMETLVAEITKLTEEIASLKELIEGKDEELNTRNSELEDLNASYKRLKSVVANAVDKRQKLGNMQERSANLSKTLTELKKENREIRASLEAEISDYKRVVANLEREKSLREKAMTVQASALRKQETANRVLAGRNDNLGKMCISMLAEMLEIDEGKLLSQRGAIKNKAQLQKVIASLQKPRRNVDAIYYPVTEGMRNALPDNLMEACYKADWNEEESF